MRFFLVIAFAFSLLACSRPAPTQTAASSASPHFTSQTFSKEFTGTINNTLPVQMTLERNGGQLSGAYHYTKFNTDIQLKGVVDDQNGIVLNEFDSQGNQTGVFKGRFISDSEIGGIWSKPNGDKEMPFSLKEGTSLAMNQPQPRPSEDFTETDDETGSNPGVDLQANAVSQATSYWNKRIAQCGSSFYWVRREKGRQANAQVFYECKNRPTIEVYGQEVPARNLSEADRLNGVDPRPIEWEGKGTFTFNTCRHHYVGESNWRGWENSDDLKFRLRRIKGKWVLDEITPNDINVVDVFEVNCPFVQKYLTAQKL